MLHNKSSGSSDLHCVDTLSNKSSDAVKDGRVKGVGGREKDPGGDALVNPPSGLSEPI